MCGRYTLGKSPGDLSRQLDFELPEEPVAARYNIAPSQEAPVILQEERRALRLLQWGLVPAWARDPKTGYRMINARAESVAQKPAYRKSFRSWRCLVPSDGFYEWKKVDGGKQPYWISLREDRVFCFAGLWDRWRGPDGDQIESFTIITTSSNSLIAPMHDRMPVILPAEAYGLWLDAESKDLDHLTRLLKPYPEEEMLARPVSKWVNNPAHEGPDCIKGVE